MNERKKEETTSPAHVIGERTGCHEDVVSDMSKFACFAKDAASTFDSLQNRHWYTIRTLWNAHTTVISINSFFFDIPQISS
jgi:hypothetical protein